MTSVTIYRFKLYDERIGAMKFSERWATREAVEKPGPGKCSLGTIVERTGIEVDSSVLDGNGMTAIGFVP